MFSFMRKQSRKSVQNSEILIPYLAFVMSPMILQINLGNMEQILESKLSLPSITTN